ncbi:MAG: BON domain-containing protein [Bacteriovoracaceae bacterium]|nr:BON domain-containing protein [Bacteriovoracaceae bacterium]
METYSGLGPKGYKRSDDSIKEEVCELLKWDPDVDASEIEVSVHKGVVTLKGSVDSRHAKRRAEIILDHIGGVKDIQNKIFLKPVLDMNSDKIVARGDDGFFSQEVTPR